MSSNDRFWLWIWAIGITGLCTLSLGGCAIQRHHTETMAKHGYEETRAVGTVETVWQKVR